MALRLTSPDQSDLSRMVHEAMPLRLTYTPVGITEMPAAPDGMRRDHWVHELGTGSEVFHRACRALESWEMHRRSGLQVAAEQSPSVDQTVAMSAPLAIGHIDVVCRVVAVEHTSRACGFTYGTLPNHPERGEERFRVLRDDVDRVSLEIVAVWAPRHPLARLFRPVAQRLQRRATERYFAAMADIVGA